MKCGSLSLDLDNLWSYLKVKGDNSWKDYPSYLDTFVPYVLDLLDEHQLRITFFIVGKDAQIKQNHDAIKEIVHRGHEVANHSLHHEPWLHLYSADKLRDEIKSAEEAIYEVTGKRTKGFRGPGFSWSPQLIRVLSDLDYVYDTSTLPTFIGPLARMYYFWITKKSKEERENLKGMYGSFKNGLLPLKPFYWEIDGQRVLELPVTTIPWFKTPFHQSYLVYLSSFSSGLMHTYLNMAIGLCNLTKTSPNFLLHPTDLMGRDLVPEMAFFPGMNVETAQKKEIFSYVIGKLSQSFHLENMLSHAQHMTNLKVKRIHE